MENSSNHIVLFQLFRLMHVVNSMDKSIKTLKLVGYMTYYNCVHPLIRHGNMDLSQPLINTLIIRWPQINNIITPSFGDTVSY